MKHMEKQLGSKLIYTGHHITVTRDDIQLIDGRVSDRDVVHHPGAVAMLALLDEQTVLLVRQYRYAAQQDMWEIPAGTLEKDEDPLDAAYRELREETGYIAGSMTPLTEFFTSPGFLTEYMHVYLARQLKADRQDLDPDEFIDVKPFSRRQLQDMLAADEIKDAKTQIAILRWLVQM